MTTEVAAKGSPAKPKAKGSSNLGRLLGAMGTVMLLSTPLTWYLTGEWGLLVWIKLMVGGLFVGYYIATNADFLAGVAGSRSSGLLIMSGVTVVMVIAMLAAVNFVAYKSGKEYDLTREGIYTLSDQSRGILERLQTDVQVLAFYGPHEPTQLAVQERLQRFADHSDKFTFRVVDPQARLDLVEEYSITETGPRLVITARGQDARVKDASEEQVTNAIIKVTEQSSKTVYFLTGHGEVDIEDSTSPEGHRLMADAIRAEGYKVETLSLIKPASGGSGESPESVGIDVTAKDAAPVQDQGGTPMAAPTEVEGLEVPAGVSVLVVAGARALLFEPEVKAIDAYLGRGGRVIVMIDPLSKNGLEGLLARWKIALHDDLVVDTNPLNRLLNLGPAAPMLTPTENKHPTTRDLTAAVVMPTARSMSIASGGTAGVDVITIVEGGESAWGETNYSGESATRDDDDHAPPVHTVLVATKAYGQEPAQLEARLMVFGDSDWVSNRYFEMQGNTDFFLNSIGWLAAEEERISIRPKTRAASRLFLSGEQMSQLSFFSMDLLPVLLVAIGLGVVLIRRQK